MKKSAFLALLIFLLPAGCANLTVNSRLESFGKITEAYQKALRMSDYSKAAKFLDPSALIPKPDFGKMKNYKIVEYNVTHMDVSESKREITQDVELQFYRLNSNILHTAHHSQTWRFDQEGKIWLLQTGLPDLGP